MVSANAYPDHGFTCPLCESPDAKRVGRARGNIRGDHVGCPACGFFEITGEGIHTAADEAAAKAVRWALSASTRRASDSDNPILITSQNWKAHADEFVGFSISMKATRLLDLIYRRSEYFGVTVRFSHLTDWPVIAAKSTVECLSILGYLRSRGLLDKDLDREQWKLTFEGWQAVEPIAGGMQGIGFVAMAFDPDLDAAYDHGIKQAIELDCGLKSYRTDKEHFPEKICDRIIVEIKRAQFVVADFTCHRPGVYFEAGYALALGRPVIWCCRHDHVEELHFDTRQYPHIVWTDPQDLRGKLCDRLRALVPGARLA